MNLNYTAAEESFRAEVRAFFEAELPADIAICAAAVADGGPLPLALARNQFRHVPR